MAEVADVQPPPEVVAALVREVRERCGAVEVEVRWLGLPALPPGVGWAWEGDPCHRAPSLRLLARRDGAPVGAWTVRPSLEIWVPGPVAPRDVAQGERFVPIEGVVPLGAGLPSGTLVALRPLRAGQPLGASLVRAAPDAGRGAEVALVVQSGAVRVAAAAVLLEDGFLGDVVAVRNTATGAVQRGRLVNPSTVTLGP